MTRTVETGYDSLGRVVSYTDADGNSSTTGYDLLGRPTSTSDGKGTQSYSYDPTSGLLTGLSDSEAGSFSASYGPDGELVSQGYPNGLRADTLYDETGAPVHLAYEKTTNCAADCTWLELEVEPSAHGQWLRHESSVKLPDGSFRSRVERFSYDMAGRLTGVEDEVAGEGCATRAYGYDLNSNRLSRTGWAPGAGGACDSSGTGSVQSSAYDEGDRITGTGFRYDAFGRLTKVPASHAGGGELRTGYYVNDMVRSQSQDGQTTAWLLDPTQQRQRASIPSAGSQEVLHYADDSDTPAWSAKLEDGVEARWSRNIAGIAGDLAAVHDSQSGTELQLQDLHGDIVATASTDPAAAAPTKTYEHDEFGNPVGESQRYGWLGAKGRRTQLPSGVIQMGVRSYVPAMGRFTSVDPVHGGSANAYDYAGRDPLGAFDLDGRFCIPCVAVGAVAGRMALGWLARRGAARALARGAGRRAARRNRRAERHERAAARTLARREKHVRRWVGRRGGDKTVNFLGIRLRFGLHKHAAAHGGRRHLQVTAFKRGRRYKGIHSITRHFLHYSSIG